MTGWAGVTGGELQDVRLIAGGQAVGVTHEFVKFSGADVISALGVVAPAIGANIGPGTHGVTGERFVGGWRFKIAFAVENSLGDNARARGYAKAVEGADLIGFSRCSIACHDAGTMCSVAVFIGCIGETPVKEECRGAPYQVRVHGRRVPCVETTVCDGHLYAGAVVAKSLHERLVWATVSGNDLRGDFIHQLGSEFGFDPQDDFRACQGVELCCRNRTSQDRTEAQFRLLMQCLQHPFRRQSFHGGCRRGDEHGNGSHFTPSFLSRALSDGVVKLVIRSIFADPVDERQLLQSRGVDVSHSRDKRILRDVLQKLHALRLKLWQHARLKPLIELYQVKPGTLPRCQAGRGLSAMQGCGRRGMDQLVAQADRFVLGNRAKRAEERKPAEKLRNTPELHWAEHSSSNRFPQDKEP